MGKEGDYCKLCSGRLACKIESHIVPSFMTYSVLGKKNQKQAFNLHFDKPKIAEKVQDTSKEAYLLCQNCEDFFQLLEREFANTIHNDLRNLEDTVHYKTDPLGNEIVRTCMRASVTLTALLVYSIIVRCHITSAYPFAEFELDKIEFRRLRNILRSYTNPKRKLLLELLAKNGACQIIPFRLSTTLTLDNPDNNSLGAFNKVRNGAVYTFALGEYLLEISLTKKIRHPLLKAASNDSSSSAIKVMLFNEDIWYRRVVKQITQWAAASGIRERIASKLPIPDSLFKI